MKKLCTILAASLTLTAAGQGSGPVTQTTPYTRGLLRATDAATARGTLGVLATNNWPITGAVLQVPILNGGTWSNPTNIGGVYSNGLFFGNVANKTVLNLLGAPSDDTSNLQAALAQGGYIVFPPGTYYTGRLWVTNSTLIEGNGATLTFLPGTNGSLLNWGANSNIVIRNLRLNGTNFASLATRPGALTNRIGITAYAYSAGSQIVGLAIQGFDCGLFFTGDKDGNTCHTSPHMTLISSELSSNGCGLNLLTPDSNHRVEYMNFISLQCYANAWNVWENAGNNDFVNCNFSSAGQVGWVSSGLGFNADHGKVVNCSFNHCNAALALTNVAAGQSFFTCAIRAVNASANLKACSGVWIVDCDLNGCGSFSALGGGTGNFLVGCIYTGQFIAGGPPGNLIVIQDSGVDDPASPYTRGTNLTHFANYSSDHFGDNDNFTIGAFSGNAAGLTNLNAANFSSGHTSATNTWTGIFVGNASGTTNAAMSANTNGTASLRDVAALIASTPTANVVSTPISLTNSAAISFDHGLGVTPSFVRWVIVCTNTDLSYAVGDELPILSEDDNPPLLGAAGGANATTVFISEPASWNTFQKGTATKQGITLSKWNIKCYARP